VGSPITTVVVLTGTGEYADPWHDFAATSSAVAVLLEALGLRVLVVPTTPEAILALGQPDLLVVDAGGGGTPTRASASSAARTLRRRATDRLTDLLAGGVPLLGLHAAANAFVDVPAFRERLGGRWVEGVSFHPERGTAHLRAASGHPVLAGRREIVIPDDERYSALEIDDDVVPLLDHEVDGVRHVAAWARDDGRGRVVYDGLGHHAPAYDTPGRRELLADEVRWLLG